MSNIPTNFLDLANAPRVAAFTTLMPDDSPQTTPVWCDYDGSHMRVNTMHGFRKEKNMRKNPKVTLLCYDPRQALRSLEVRGEVVEMTEEGATEHLDNLTFAYIGKKPYFGECVPVELKDVEIPILCKIIPLHVVTLDARKKDSNPIPLDAHPPLPDLSHSTLPASHLDLLTRPIHGVLTTLMPNGQPQSSLVWCDYDGECARINTSLERQKGQNLSRNPLVSLLIVDPENTARFIQIRGSAELVLEGALEHLDAITRQYTNHPQYYGYVFPAEKQGQETRIICRVHTKRVTVDAIHN
jgi:PPOX class probable F420-dependent enzyme